VSEIYPEETDYSDFVYDLSKPGKQIIAELSPKKAHCMHMAVGVSGEAGELLDAFKKWVIYGKPLDVENVIEELGDIEFYAQGLRNAFGVTREQVLAANIKKLNKRCPSGKYSNKQAIDRADKAGRGDGGGNFLLDVEDL